MRSLHQSVELTILAMDFHFPTIFFDLFYSLAFKGSPGAGAVHFNIVLVGATNAKARFLSGPHTVK